jgi:hypothetical protein
LIALGRLSRGAGVRIIRTLSAVELATTLSVLGYDVQIDRPIQGVGHLRFLHEGFLSFICLHPEPNGAAGQFNVMRFYFMDLQWKTQIDFSHIDRWSDKCWLGRLGRNNTGVAEVDWAVPMFGTTEKYLGLCCAAWSSVVLPKFLEFCTDVRSP